MCVCAVDKEQRKDACDLSSLVGSLHIWKGSINANRYIQVIEQNILYSHTKLLLVYLNYTLHFSKGTIKCRFLRFANHYIQFFYVDFVDYVGKTF